MIRRVCLLLLSGSVAAMPIAAVGSSTVYIIRHGEKNWALGCLSPQGESRANALPGVFNGQPSSQHVTFSAPQFLFANRYDDPVDCERCVQTLSPTAAALQLPVNNTYGYPPWIGGNGKGAAAIKQTLVENPGSTVLVACPSYEAG
jgi:hypothetical protein